MNLIRSIRTLRIVALFLFLAPAIGLLGSLLISNYLVTFKFERGVNYNFKTTQPDDSIKILCNENNNYCEIRNYKKFNRLDECYKYNLKAYLTNEDGDILVDSDNEDINYSSIKNMNEKVYANYQFKNQLNDQCIINSDKFFMYKFFPFLFENIYDLRMNKKTRFGTSEAVNPFFKGETSISNIVKRFPISYFFKPVLFITVIFMIMYWYNFNLIIKNLTSYKKNFYFFYFGMLSALFLLLHVIFLGWVFESEFLTKLRRTFVVFFIFFEIISQAFLIKKILSIKDEFYQYFNSLIISFKLIFVIFICSTSILILTILIFYNLPSNIDYILEWNYFLILLIFYFLSYLMWKKLTTNPTSA
tara:strand:+ start:2515 stop:3594 length:1080 start_codon:yes stop_codon:yes gene_type:complete